MYFVKILMCFASFAIQAPPDSPWVEQAKTYELRFDAVGTPLLKEIAATSLIGYRFQGLINVPGVREEIELSKSQLKSFKNLDDQLSRRTTEFLRKHGGDDPNGRLFAEYMDASYESGNSQLNEILLPIQLERLEQISMRIELRKAGLASFVDTNRDRLSLSFSEKQFEKFGEGIREFQSETLPSLKEECADEVNRILGVLSTSQMRTMEEMTRGRSLQTVGPDIALAQLRYAIFLNEDFSGQDDETQLRFFSQSPIFRMSAGGRFFPFPTAHEGVDDFWYLECENFLSQIECTDISIPEDDLVLIQESFENLKKNEQAATAIHVSKLSTIADEKEIYDFRMRFHEERIESRSRWRKDLFKSISPIGKQVLFDYFAARCMRSYGVIASLLHGPLGARLEVTETQKERLLAETKISVERLKSSFQAKETRLLKNAFAALGKESEAAIKNHLGPPLKHLEPTFVTLVSDK